MTIGMTLTPAVLLDSLRERMIRLAEAKRYEDAAEVRDRYKSLGRAIEHRRAWQALMAAGTVWAEDDSGDGVVVRHGHLVASWNDGSSLPLVAMEEPVESIPQVPESVATAEAWVRPTEYRAYALDQAAFRTRLARVPLESDVSLKQTTEVIALPMPDGNFARFAIVESPVMEPELAAKYPQIKTYKVVSINDKTVTGRLDTGPKGFHAYLRSSEGEIYIDPVSTVQQSFHHG